MTNRLRDDFLSALRKTYKAYNIYGARSSKKLIAIHSWFAKEIVSGLGKNYSVKSLGYDGEYTIEGKYYPKISDITIFNNQKPVVTLSFKFVTSNYAQNSNNYFENLLGETANIRRTGVGFVHFLVLRGYAPYYDKAGGGKRGKLKRIETLSEYQIKKYIELFKDLDFPHKPDVLGIAVVDFNDKAEPYWTDFNDLGLKDDTIKLLQNEFSVETFIEKVRALCQLKK